MKGASAVAAAFGERRSVNGDAANCRRFLKASADAKDGKAPKASETPIRQLAGRTLMGNRLRVSRSTYVRTQASNGYGSEAPHRANRLRSTVVRTGCHPTPRARVEEHVHARDLRLGSTGACSAAQLSCGRFSQIKGWAEPTKVRARTTPDSGASSFQGAPLRQLRVHGGRTFRHRTRLEQVHDIGAV